MFGAAWLCQQRKNNLHLSTSFIDIVLTRIYGLVLQNYLYCVSAENSLNLIALLLLTEFIQKSIKCPRILKSEIERNRIFY